MPEYFPPPKSSKSKSIKKPRQESIVPKSKPAGEAPAQFPSFQQIILLATGGVVAALGFLVLLVLLTRGGETPSPKDGQASGQQNHAPKLPLQEMMGEDPGMAAPTMPNPPIGEPSRIFGSRANPIKPGSKRPEKLSDWTVQDFQTALDEGDEKILDAIQTLGQPPWSSEADLQTQTAEKLLAILKLAITHKPQSQPFGVERFGEFQGGLGGPMRRAGGRFHQPLSDKVCEAILKALGNNSGKVALNALENTILGEAVVDDHAWVSDAARFSHMALQGMLNRFDHSADARNFVWGLLLGERKFSPEIGPDDARDLYHRALTEVEKNTSSEERVELAKRYLGLKTKTPQSDLVLASLLQHRAENLPAQVHLYATAELHANQQKFLEAEFLKYSQSTMRELLGLPDRPYWQDSDPYDAMMSPTSMRAPRSYTFNDLERMSEPSTEPKKGFTVRDVPLVVKTLWNQEFVELVAKKLTQPQPNREFLVPLLGSIPTASARMKLLEDLKIHAESVPFHQKQPPQVEVEGYAVLLGLGEAPMIQQHPSQFDASWYDPGAILALKDLNQKQPRLNLTDPQKLTPEEKTFIATYQYLDELNARLGFKNENPSDPLIELPQSLAEAVKQAETRIDWPAQAKPKLGDANLEPLSLHYMRLHSKLTEGKVIYEVKKLSQREQLQVINPTWTGQTELQERLTWANNSHRQTEFSQSTDILVRPTVDGVVIEILVVRVSEPKSS